MTLRDGRSITKPRNKGLSNRILLAASLLLVFDLCRAFPLHSPIRQPTKREEKINKNFRWELQSKRPIEESKVYITNVKRGKDKTLLLGKIPEILAACFVAVSLCFGANPALASSGDVPEYLSITERDIQIQSNKKLVDYAVGTINTQFYDSSGGARFNPSDFYRQWRDVQSKLETVDPSATNSNNGGTKTPMQLEELGLDTRDATVQTLKYLVSTLKDPYSKYMTREELQYELRGSHDGFLGTGAYIEVPKTFESTSSPYTASASSSSSSSPQYSFSSLPKSEQKSNFQANIARERLEKKKSSKKTKQVLLTNTKVANLPVVTAVAPNSPAERAGLVVGDKIVGVGDKDNFLGYGKDEIRKCLGERWGYSDPSLNRKLATKRESSSRYFGVADLTIAKPVYSYSTEEVSDGSSEFFPNDDGSRNREIVLGYRSTKVKLPTIATDSTSKALASGSNNKIQNLRGDAVVQYDLLTASSAGVESTMLSTSSSSNIEVENSNKKVGYIRLTRFSKSSTEGYLNAVKTLEEEGAQSYVIDLRNNYGGVIQEAMLTASTLLGDQHAILCYLLNARGGFTPVDVESYVVDPRYPGYLLSKEDKSFVLEQTMKENPKMFRTVAADERIGRYSKSVSDELLPKGAGNKRLVADWDPPSSYASIHEQVAKRGIRRITYASFNSYDGNSAYGGADSFTVSKKSPDSSALYRQRLQQQKSLQKDVVLLINEGTASSAEFFVAALQDNGRSLAVVGNKSFGKGIIQHTFPMPDGGGLKLTIGEFLRPSLKHVTNAFSVGFLDKNSGEIVGGGGVNPDVYCESRQGIPGSPKSDLCVKVALDVLEEHRSSEALPLSGSNIIANEEQ